MMNSFCTPPEYLTWMNIVFQSHNHKGGPQNRHPNHSYTYLISHPIKSLEVYAYFHYIHTRRLFQGLKFTFLLCNITQERSCWISETRISFWKFFIDLPFLFFFLSVIYHFYTFWKWSWPRYKEDAKATTPRW